MNNPLQLSRPDVSSLDIVTHNDQNVKLTKGLFYETSRTQEKYVPVLTLREQDYKGYTSIHRLYVQFADPSEYIFATAVLGSYEHWQILKSRDWFIPYYKKMQEAMVARLRGVGQVKMMDLAFEDGDKQAIKWLAQGEFMQNPDDISARSAKRSSKGRPSKEEVQGELAAAAKEEQEAQDALAAAKEASTDGNS